MKDLLEQFHIAKKHYCFRNSLEFQNCICALQSEFPDLTMDRDDGAGERWARLWNQNLWIMVHQNIGIAFMRSSKVTVQIPKSIAHLTVVSVDVIDAEEWYLDLDQLALDIPEVCWHACVDAVDPTAFSLNDLYYATV